MDEMIISVGSLIEYSLKSGSIDFEYMSLNRAQEGIAFHQIIQKKREAEAARKGHVYYKEVPFKERFHVFGIDIIVRGRADGVLKINGITYIEEIKSTVKPLELISDNIIHVAQAKCYAYFYALKNNIDNIFVILNYVNVETHENKEFEYSFCYDELKGFFDAILNDYAKWAAVVINLKDIRNKSIHKLSFPFDEYRAGQREMSVSIYRTIERKKNIFINAPTGIGKTISALFPAIKAMGIGKTDKIFYLTAKTITRQVALNAAELMKEKGLCAKTIVITAKDKICFLDKAVCNPVSCQYADGHFDSINAAVEDILGNEDILTKETVERYAEKHKVCPYEYSLDIAVFSDIIICDYNYAFDKWVYLRRFFAETSEEYVFLTDEAHNLVDRAREMYSASVSLRDMKGALKHIKKSDKELKQIKELIENIKEYLIKLSEDITGDFYGIVYDAIPKQIYRYMRDFKDVSDIWISENRNKSQTEQYEVVMELYFSVMRMLSVNQLFDDKYVCYCAKDGRDVILKLFCVNPATCLKVMLKNARSSVFFSATLTPLNYFKELLGASKDDYAILLDSPFPKENMTAIVCSCVSTKYKKREKYHEIIADYIYTAVTEKKGNYFAFFPSYAYMDSVYFEFASKYSHIKTAVQSPSMEEEEKDKFLEGFESEGALVAFAVLGGMFSEGIDLPGDKLIGAFIISVGLPKVSFERFIISQYFNDKKGLGFEYAYIYPGMNKVMQAGGRVIRTMSDKGIILLIDERFTERAYNALLPASWGNYKVARNIKMLKTAVESFWTTLM